VKLPDLRWQALLQPRLPRFATSLLHDRTVRLAVTGLSRAGKSVFVTALVHDLLAFPRTPARLPLFGLADGLAARIVGVEIEGAGGAGIAPFRYAENLRAMAADPPRWPEGTRDVAGIALRIRFRPQGFLHRPDAEAALRLVIVDYPGEWLLDLPLLARGFAEWSADMIALARSEARLELAAEWLAFLDRHRADAPHDEAAAREGHALYRAYLRACRDRLGAAYLQPGRFVEPGNWSDPSLLEFCPMPPGGGAGTLGQAMEARFEGYKRAVRAQFFDRHFRAFDRQIVLVDLLQALHAGQAAFADTARTLADIGRAFRIGGGVLARLFGSRIDRVLYAATKADHVPGMQRDHLRQLLANMLKAPIVEAGARGAATAVLALASVRCTVDDETVMEGRPVQVVRGVPVTGFRQVKFFPGTIPIRPPAPDDPFWRRPFFAMPRFQPPRLDAAAATGIGHIGLDEALDFLIADHLA
jgi:predicted YcjX-like family ATPase